MRARAWGAWAGAAIFCFAFSQGAVADGAAGNPGNGSASGKGAAAKADADPPTTKVKITLSPSEIAWGIDEKQLIAIYDKVIDADFAERYKKVQPGPDMQALDAEVQQQKDAFRNSKVTFDKAPSGIDSTPLKGEYAYGNKESLMRITRAAKTRDFFFVGGRLWKVVDELPLGEKAMWGRDFQEATGKVGVAYGVAGRARGADSASGRNFNEVDWQDATSQVRAVDWGNGRFALVFQDRKGKPKVEHRS